MPKDLCELEERLYDLECELEEVQECGDLEDRLDVLDNILKTKREIERVKRNG